jgi:1-acyl-sn-glycerol-3-phosphate acyltransferase
MSYPQPLQLRLRRAFIKGLFRNIFRILFKLEIEGLENVPASGAYLMAHNHVSIIEPAFILAFWPVNAEAIGAQELWSRPGQNLVIRFYGTTPVQRGVADRGLIKTMLEVLGRGSPLLIAPEGTRSHVPGMGRAQPGIGYLVEKARVPVLPIAIIGSTDKNLKLAFEFKRPQLKMVIGAPFALPPIESSGKARREARQQRADEVLIRVGEFLPESYWGVYEEEIRNIQAGQ